MSLTHQLAMEKIAQEDAEPGFIISKNNIGKIAFKKKRLYQYLILKVDLKS